MKILFIKAGNENLGSHRIYFNNLTFFLKKYFPNDFEIEISKDFKENFDIYILSKSITFKQIFEFRKKTKAKIGIISPSDSSFDGKKKIEISDFFICGCITEVDYYYKYKKKIILFPLIEIIDQKLVSKNDDLKSKNIIKIGYHGALEHLKEWPDELTFALEKLSKEISLKLIVVYNKSLGNWSKPNINIEEYDWTLEEMIKQMSSVDIGLVPSLRKNNFFSGINILKKYLLKLTTTSPSSTKNDYVIQYKNTTNNGRALVFHELKVPVVADFSPENFIINGDSDCGYLAKSVDGWYNAIKALATDEKKRKRISNNAFTRFSQLYDKKKITEKFAEELKTLNK